MSKQPLIILAVLVLALLACTLTAPPGAMAGEVQQTPTPGPTWPTGAAYVLTVSPTQPATQPPTQPKPTPTQALETVGHTCLVNTQALNVRACAGLDCAAIAWLYAGDVATIVPTPHPTEWLPIEGGWIYAKFCEVSK